MLTERSNQEADVDELQCCRPTIVKLRGSSAETPSNRDAISEELTMHVRP